jgi:hypothetical protein
MSSFKHKTNKLKYISKTQTLDELHHGYLAKFCEKKKTLPQKKNDLNELNIKLNELSNASNSDISNIKLKSEIINSIKELENEINKIDNNIELLEYISRTGDILIDYYDSTSGIYYGINSNPDPNSDENNIMSENEPVYIDAPSLAKQIESNQKQSLQHEKCNYNINNNSDNKELESDSNTHMNISDKLKKLNELSQKNRKIKKPVKKRKIPIHVNQPQKSILYYLPVIPTTSIVSINSMPNVLINTNYDSNNDQNNNTQNTNIPSISRAGLQDKYLRLVDKSYTSSYSKNNQIVYCTKCTDNLQQYTIEKKLHQSEGCYICEKCGETESLIIESEIPSHKDVINEKQKYPYKKSNHLKEKLNQFQSKENADIEDRVYEIILKDLKKRRISPEKITPPLTRAILKKYRLTEYYEHLQQIYCKISGATPVTLPRDVEETIINMFQKMQESFSKHCPPTRSNFLNYSYVLNKMFRILDLEKHAKYFSLLKSKDKLREQDNIWEKICDDMGWKFHSSFCRGR